MSSGEWRRVLIVGGPGSGKTTLGRTLACAMNVPYYELDVVGYEGGAGPARPSAVRLADIAGIANQHSWVAEGSFIDWTDALAQAADAIVWLDVPWRVARWRIVSRHAQASLKRVNKHRGLRKLWRFVKTSKGYYTDPSVENGREQTAMWLAAFGGKVYRCRHNREVKEVIDDSRQHKPRR